MNDLIIVDFNTSSIHFYKVDYDADIDEDYLEKLGFHTNECFWIFAEDMEIIKHKGILK